ncbi:hypothetical protein FEF65_02920 [Mariprofundus erugo]|uniref:Uncharacterized protein n=1 Tax=Mariprofundus erugo TaxID=2528639 RepID=A0A5R9GRZ1_9PROT|nr:YajG family lipoprotein [Mariprofundus erugo]TLS68670.1 hypothetical protein FEF65_02920 [Mariprofundus erugo]
MWRFSQIVAMTLLLAASSAQAESMTTAIAMKAGEGANTALSIEDARTTTSAGQTVDGNVLVTPTDITASLYDYMTRALTTAGYHVIPYTPQLASGVVIHIRAIEYSSSRHMLKSKVEVRVVLDAKENSSDTTRTYRIEVEDQFAFSPSSEDNSQMLGNGLAAAATAVLGDFSPTMAPTQTNTPAGR